jgi:hypothetical protein
MPKCIQLCDLELLYLMKAIRHAQLWYLVISLVEIRVFVILNKEQNTTGQMALDTGQY